MTTLKQLKPVLNFIKKSRRPILQHIKVNENGLLLTDLETSLLIKDNFNLDYGYHNITTLGVGKPSVIDSDDFPMISLENSKNDEIKLNVDLLEDLSKYCSNDETRIFLNCIAVNDNHLVATDGYKLQRYKIDNEVNKTYLIPKTSIKVLIRLLKKFKIKDNFTCQLDSDNILIDNDCFTFSSRLIQRDYVKWQAVIPKRFAHKVTINNWIDLKELKPLFDQRSFGCKIVIKNEKVMLEINNVEKYEYEIGFYDNKELITLDQEKIECEIGFNVKFLDIAIGKTKESVLKFNNESSPTEINGAIVLPFKQ